MWTSTLNWTWDLDIVVQLQNHRIDPRTIIIFVQYNSRTLAKQVIDHPVAVHYLIRADTGCHEHHANRFEWDYNWPVISTMTKPFEEQNRCQIIVLSTQLCALGPIYSNLTPSCEKPHPVSDKQTNWITISQLKFREYIGKYVDKAIKWENLLLLSNTHIHSLTRAFWLTHIQFILITMSPSITHVTYLVELHSTCSTIVSNLISNTNSSPTHPRTLSSNPLAVHYLRTW